jgi:peptide/nickel transport system permease protein
MRRKAQSVAVLLLCCIAFAALCAGWVTPYSYAHQFRELPNATPSAMHLLGTDALGRDLLSRILYGTRVSLFLAPLAALVTTVLAGMLGVAAGLLGGWWERVMLSIADLAMALPLLFVLIALRALLPLDVAPMVSIGATFLLLGLFGWPAAVRVVWAATRNIRESDYLLLARSQGSGLWRIIFRQVFPNLRPILLAQFWVSVPFFILTETTLSMLGLGVMEPLPSWGNLLRGLEDVSSLGANPWKVAPLVLLICVVLCFQMILPAREEMN